MTESSNHRIIESSNHRLKKRADFLAAAASGRKWVRPAFVMQYRPDTGEPVARLGFTVTKKQGNAVRRNHIRRRLKEAARLALPPVVRPACDYVIIGRAAAAEYPFDKLMLELADAVSKLHELHQRKKSE